MLNSTPARVPIRRIGTDGFTLIELVITIALVGVLTTIAMPAFLNTLLQAKAVGAKEGIHTMLLKAYVGVKSSDLQRNQLLAEPLAGMEPGATMAFARDGQFAYYGRLTADDLYVVEAEAMTDSSLVGKVLVGCIDLEAGTVVMQQDFDRPLEGCGLEGAQAQGQGQGQIHGQGWGVGGTPNPQP